MYDVVVTPSTYIKNSKLLSRTPERGVALSLLEEGLSAIATDKVIQNAIAITKDEIVFTGCDKKESRVPIASINRIFVVAIGKCSIDASKALERIFGEKIHEGIAVDVRGDLAPLKKIALRVGTHPYPSDQNVEYSKEILALLQKVEKDDLVLFIISGGASTLLCNPDNHSCEDD